MLTGKELLAINLVADKCYQASVDGGWWHDIHTGEPLERDRLNMLMLIVTEIAEAAEGERKALMDKHLPHRPNTEVELADAVIRIFDYSKGHGYDVAGAISEKLEYNATRADHKPENRAKDGGKKW